MKKLLAILASTGLITSTGASVTACSISKIKSEVIANFLGEIARASYLNSRYGYDMNFMIDTNLDFESKEYKNVFEQLFKGELFANQIELNNVSLDLGKKPEDGDTLLGVFNVVKKLLQLDESQDKSSQLKNLIEECISMLGFELNSQEIIESNDDLETIGDTLKLIGSNLTFDKYVGKNWNEAFQTSLSEWAKQISANAGILIEEKTDFVKIVDEMEREINGELNFSYLFSGDAMGGLVDFAKLTLIYLSELVSNYKIDVSALTTEQIRNLRSSTISSSIKIDLKKILVDVNDALFGQNSSSTGPIALENILTALLLDTNKNYVPLENTFSFLLKLAGDKSHDDRYNTGVGKFLATIINCVPLIDIDRVKLGNFLVDLLETISSGTQYMADLIEKTTEGEEFPISELAIRIIFTSLLGEGIPSQLDPIINNLASLLTNSNPLETLWKHNIIGNVLFLLSGINGNFSIDDLLTGPLSELLGIKNLFGLELTGDLSSIKGILNSLVSNLGDESIILDIHKLGKILETVGDLLKVLPPDVDAIVKWLEENGGEAINYLYDIIEDTQGLDKLMQYLIGIFEDSKAEIIKRAITEFSNLKYDVKIDGNKYTYEIERSTVIITTDKFSGNTKISKITVI